MSVTLPNLSLESLSLPEINNKLTAIRTWLLSKTKPSGYPSLDATSLIPTAQMGTATASATTVLYGNRTWGKVTAVGMPIFANNAAAVAGGLAVGSIYRSGADPDVLSVVH